MIGVVVFILCWEIDTPSTKKNHKSQFTNPQIKENLGLRDKN